MGSQGPVFPLGKGGDESFLHLESRESQLEGKVFLVLVDALLQVGDVHPVEIGVLVVGPVNVLPVIGVPVECELVLCDGTNGICGRLLEAGKRPA